MSLITKAWTALVLVVSASASAGVAVPPGDAAEAAGYVVVATYPHDPDAYTQGLDFNNGRFFETTGRGPASLRLVELATGAVKRQTELSEEYFGEGMTIMDRRLWWITWQSEKAFLYRPGTFELVRTFDYKGEGWGLTHNGRRLIMSDGTPRIVFRDPKTFEIRRKITVTDKGEPVGLLNELEWVKGEILANVWHDDVIARINPSNGNVVGWIDITELKQAEPDGGATNGIAYMSGQDRLFVTGKNWSHVYEIQPTD